MKNVTFLGAVLLACSTPAFAQTPDNTSRPAQPPDSNSQSTETTRSGNTAGAQKALVGCISERNGRYFLMTNNRSKESSQMGSPTNEPTGSQSSQSGTQSGQSSPAPGQSTTSSPSSTQSSAQSTDRSATHSHAIELITTQDLKAHVGHTVRVTGTMENRSSMGTSSNPNSTEPNSNDPNSRSSQENSNNRNRTKRALRVTDLQHLSESCNMNNEPGNSPRQ